MAGDVRLEGKNALRAQKMLARVCSILHKARVPFCIDGGTLLGIIREQRLLPWDNDMDFYVSAQEQARLERKLFWLRLAGYRVRKKFAAQDYGPIKQGQLRLIKIKSFGWFGLRDVILIDIFIKYPVEGKTYWIVGDKKAVLKSVDSHFYERFDKVEFLGQTYPTPADVENYLSVRYGDWRTPVKEWNCLTDDRAISS